MAAHGRLTVAAVLVAGGSGQRLGAAVPKAFVSVAGRTLLDHARSRFVAHPDVDEVVVVTPSDRVAEVPGAVAGGATRQASVAAGLAATGDVDVVLVHDVARPFVPPQVITAVVAAIAHGADAAIPVVPLHDTIRRVDADGAFAGLVDRATLVAVQTPQAFRRDILVRAHRDGAALDVTDDAALVEALGYTVVPVPGDESAFKITRPWDLAVAETLAARIAQS